MNDDVKKLIEELVERVQKLEYRCHNTLDNYIGNVREAGIKTSENAEDTDQLILDHEERLILLEVGE